MSHRAIFIIGLTLAWVGACARTGGGGGSNTNWLRCTSDRDCVRALMCVERHCVARASADDGATGSGASSSGGAQGSLGGATSNGGTGGARGSRDGATNAGGTGSVAEASNGGNARDAGIDASADAAPPPACNVTSTTLLTYTGIDVDQIVLDGGYLYFHDETGISRVPRFGGSPAQLVSMHTESGVAEHAFVVGDSGITWGQPGSSADGSIVTNVNRAAKTGGPVTTLATLPAADGTLSYSSIAFGPAGSVFLWTGPGSLTPVLLQVRPDGAVESWGRLYFYYNNINDVVFDGTDVFSTGDNGVYVHVSNSVFDGFTSVTTANEAQDIELDGTTMYIGSSDVYGDITVYSAPKAGGKASVLFNGASSGIFMGNLVIDANYLYVVERATAAVVRMGKDGANPTEIVKGIQYERIVSVAVDDTCIYWSLQGSNQGSTRTRSGLYAAPKSGPPTD